MKNCFPAFCVAVSIGSSIIFSTKSFSAPTSAPVDSNISTEALTTDPATRSPKQLVDDISSDNKAVNELLGKDNAVLKSAAGRTAVAPKLVPALRTLCGDLGQLAVAVPKYRPKIAGMLPELVAMLSVLGDKNSSERIQSMAKSQNPSNSETGQFEEFLERWLVADKTVSAQSALIDDLEKLDKAHPDSIPLTVLTSQLRENAASPALTQRLLAIATDEMDNPAAKAIKQQFATRKAADDKLTAAENKPLTIAGTTPDGKAFTSADLKGKVVLVDFWATWCVPCKEEMPRVKKMYSDYHDKGLEIVGVSNDFNVNALSGFIAKESMPWPELFDADAAANHDFNPITPGQGAIGIPLMYLIDKKGILRSVTARENMEELIPKLLAEAN